MEEREQTGFRLVKGKSDEKSQNVGMRASCTHQSVSETPGSVISIQ